jgi:ribosomal protein S18 acetylase RimI-like enzyme
MTIRQLTPADTDELVEFFAALSERDLTFIREDVHDAHAISQLPESADTRWVAADAGVIKGYAAVERLPGWSDHVGELRLVVRPDSRGTGIGRALAQHALSGALASGMRKVVVELAADQESAIAMFSGLGFTGEALLRDHIRDRHGDLRDLVVLAHHIDEGWSSLDAVGLADALMP